MLKRLIKHQGVTYGACRIAEEIKTSGSPLWALQSWVIDENGRCCRQAEEVITTNIKKALTKAGGKNKGQDGTAYLLVFHLSTLQAKIEKLGIPYGKTAIGL